jgi:hypothetical protein
VYEEREIAARKRIHAAVQESNDSDPSIEGAILIGYVMVAEWMDPEGERWLSTISGIQGGDDSPPPWQVEGYLHNVLYHGDSFEEGG